MVYRRVNQRTERAVYFVRNQEEIVTSCAGSVYLTLVDACKGFNQIVNTERARQMLAILARSGQYLPRCLTFGPTIGPEDFAFATECLRRAKDAGGSFATTGRSTPTTSRSEPDAFLAVFCIRTKSIG